MCMRARVPALKPQERLLQRARAVSIGEDGGDSTLQMAANGRRAGS
jgi:hypothetical protein